jgi:hypothetical protein
MRENVLGRELNSSPSDDANDEAHNSAPVATEENPAKSASSTPKIPWIASGDNPRKVPLLDVRPVTLTMTSLSRNPQCAANAVPRVRQPIPLPRHESMSGFARRVHKCVRGKLRPSAAWLLRLDE